MKRLLSVASRGGLALSLALLTMAFLRWEPVGAETPLDVRALPLAPWVLILGVLAAVTGGERPRKPVRRLVVALAGSAFVLVLIVAARPPAGLAPALAGPRGSLGELPPGPIDMVADDLAQLPRAHRERIAWSGFLRPPVSGFYRLWAGGEGWVSLRLDGEGIFSGALLPAGAGVFLREGPHTIEVEHGWLGPPVHFRLGWTRPRSDGRPGGTAEVIPLRCLGPPLPSAIWIATDALTLLIAALVGWLSLRLRWDLPRRPPAPMPVTKGEVAGVLVGLVAVVLVMSFPLALDPAGSGVVDRVDGRLNAWILAWDVHAFLTHPLRAFQAPIFHPLPDALAFSENLLLPAFVVAPLVEWGGPVLGYNVALLLSMVLSGLGAHLLVRRVSGDRLAAFVGGALFAAGAHRWFRLAHLHAQVTVFLPFALWSLDRFWEVRSARRALGVALCLLLQGLSSIYLGVITATTLGLAILVGVLGGLGGRAFLRLALSLAAAGLFLLPTLRPYLRMRSFEGKEWSLAEIGRFATTPESYAASATRLYGPLTERHADDSRTREPLFPGAVPLVLGVAGLAVAPRRYRAVALGMTGLAFVLSLGPSTAVYRFLYDHVLVFRGVRALNRFSLVPALALSVLSGLALSGRRWRGLALVAAMIEATNVPLGYGLYAPPPPSARWLAGKEGAVAYLPLGERDTEVMLEGIAHFRPLLNGDSGFVPVPYDREMELFEGGVTEEGRRLLRALDVQHVVARTDLSLPLAARFGEDRIYTVPLGEAAQFVSGGTPAPSLWSSAGATADLGVPRTIDRVLFEIGAGSWDDAPSVALSKDGHVWEHVRARASFADAILSLTRDPRHARGELRFPSREARFVRFDRRVPAAPGIVWVAP